MDRSHPLRALLSSGGLYSLGTLLTQLVSFLLLPVYTRYLGTSDYGALSVVLVAQAVLSALGGLGLVSGVIRYYHASEDPTASERLVGTAFAALVTSAGTLWLLTQLAIPRLAPLIAPFDGGAQMLRIASTTAALQPFALLFARLFQMREQPGRFVASTLVQFAVTVSVTLWLVVVRGMGPTGVLLGALCGVGVVAAAGIATAAPQWYRHRVDGALVRKLVGFSVPLVPTALMGLSLALADRFFLEHMADLHETGVYAVADRFATVLRALVFVPFGQAWIQYAFARQRDAELPSVFARTMRWLAVGGSTAVLLYCMAAREAVEIATPAPFHPGYRVIPLLAAAGLAHGFVVLLGAGIHLANATRWVPLLFAVPTAVNLGLNAVLIPHWGMWGAAGATALAAAVQVSGYLVLSRRFYPVAYPLARSFGTVAAAAVALTVWVSFDPPGHLASLLLRLACLTGYAAAVWLLGGVTRRDLAVALRVFARLRGRR